MKKILFILIASLMFSGSIFAQHETHWPYMDNLLSDYGIMVVAVSIDNNMITMNDNYWDYEVATFVGEECRGHMFLTYSNPDPYPVADQLQAWYYDNSSDWGVEISFKLYDHVNEIEYVICTSSETVLTTMDYVLDETHDYWADPIILNFSSSFTKEIDPWTAEGGYYLIASPLNAAEGVSPEEVLNMTNDSYDLYYFDQNAADGLEWINYKDSNDGGYNLTAGTGYLYANSTGDDITFIGAPYNGNGEVTLTKVDNVEFSGWNLVGNPFPQAAYIDRAEFYVMNPEGGTDIIAGEGNTVGPMEGIFVIAAQDGEKVTFSTENPGKAKGLVINVLKNRGSVIDRAIVRFGEGGMLPKFMLNEGRTKLYIPQNDNEYAVVTTDTKTNELPLNFKAAEEGTYVLKFNTENVETGYLHLIDNLTGNDVDLLANPVYTFDARLIDYASRFRLVFNDTFANSIENMSNGSFAIVNNGNLIINNVDGIATLEMIDITGRIISTETINGSCIKDVKVKAGVYTLRLIQDENIRTQKVVVE